MKLTLQIARESLRAADMIISKTEYGEYRVNFPRGDEKDAYYTTDLKDAIGTGLDMRNRVKKNPRAYPGQDYTSDEDDEFGWGVRGRRKNPSVMWGAVRLINKAGNIQHQMHVGSDAERKHMLGKLTAARKREPSAQWRLQQKPILSGWRDLADNPRSSKERKALAKYLEGRGIQTYFMHSLADLRDLKKRDQRGDRMRRKLKRNPRRRGLTRKVARAALIARRTSGRRRLIGKLRKRMGFKPRKGWSRKLGWVRRAALLPKRRRR